MKLKSIVKIFKYAIFIFNVIAIIFLLLSAFSDRVSPNTAIIFAHLGLLFPVILIVNIIFTIWWLLTWKWKFLLINIVILFICSDAIFTYFPIHFRTKEIPKDCIKVLTYNVMRFNQFKKHTEGSPNRVITYILNANADIVCLQEYGVTNFKHLITQQEVDNIFEKKYPYRKYIATIKEYDTEGGIAIYSKFPINSIEKIPFESCKYNGACVAELDIRGKKVRLINNHLESNKLSVGDQVEYAGLIRGIRALDSKKIESITEIMRRRLSVSFKIRALQAEMVAEYVKNSDTPYIIVCGDFNDTPISYSRRTIMGNILEDSYAKTGFGPGITYNRNRFWFRIDFILHSKNIKSYNSTVGKLKDSDHYPVWTYLQLK
ncbi:MAG: endonuclease/exonuclease/phosphatase family protein [Candidatus Azobacteroides sp.]|nr:endonuclease/exonuclease/phosphatase family protein [Candidatus Azobacteroides sp.]